MPLKGIAFKVIIVVFLQSQLYPSEWLSCFKLCNLKDVPDEIPNVLHCHQILCTVKTTTKSKCIY